jgi:hypothetical protein
VCTVKKRNARRAMDGSKIDADRGKLNVDLIRPESGRKVYDFYIIAPDSKFLAT